MIPELVNWRFPEAMDVGLLLLENVEQGLCQHEIEGFHWRITTVYSWSRYMLHQNGGEQGFHVCLERCPL